MKKHLILSLFVLNIQMVFSQSSSKIENMQLFKDIFHVQINDSIITNKYDISGVVQIIDTAHIKSIEVCMYEIDTLTNQEVIINSISTNINLLYATNDNSIPGFFIEDNKVFFTIKNVANLTNRYIRFKVIDNAVLDSISMKLNATN